MALTAKELDAKKNQKRLDTSTMALEALRNVIKNNPGRIVELKNKTKVIAITNHNRNKTQSEPIRDGSKYKQLASSPGKRVQASHDWFWFNV